MKNLWWMIQFRLQMWLENWVKTAGILALPLVSILIYLPFYNTESSESQITISMVEDSSSHYQPLLADLLDDSVDLNMITEEDKQNASSSDNAMAIITLPADFDDQVASKNFSDLQIVTTQGSEITDQVKATVDGAISELLQYQSLEDTQLTESSLADLKKETTPDVEYRFGKNQRLVVQMSTNIVGVFLLMVLYQSSGFGPRQISEERRNKVFQRLMSTPLGRGSYFGGTLIVGSLFMILEIVIMMVALYGVFGINPGVTPLQFAYPLTIFGFIAIAWSMATTVLAPSEQVATGINVALFTVTSQMSGSLIPLEVMPDFVQKLAMVTPQYYALELLRAFQEGITRQAFLINTAALAAFLLLFVSIAFYAFSNQRRIGEFD